MKKWLVYGIVGQHKRIANSFNTLKEATSRLNKAGFERVSKYIWKDSFGQIFTIQKKISE